VGRGCVPPHRKWGQGMGLCPSPELHAEKVIFGAYFVYVCYFLTTARLRDTVILCRKVDLLALIQLCIINRWSCLFARQWNLCANFLIGNICGMCAVAKTH